MDENLKSLIDSANSVVVVLPTNPNLDQVASALSIYLTAGKDKDISVSCPADMTVEFNRLVGVDKITKDTGNKNLVIKFADYQATGIERVSYDIEDGEFKLTVIPKSGVTAPGKDQVIMSYSGISADLILLIGGQSADDYPLLEKKEVADTKKVFIGINNFDAKGKSIQALAAQAPSVSELVGYLLKSSGYQIDADSATNLLAGIEVGTNGFSSPLVNADTFQLVADLLRSGGKRREKAVDTTSLPKGSIPQAQINIPQQEQAQQQTQTQKAEEDNNPPEDWTGPKIYKGTSVS